MTDDQRQEMQQTGELRLVDPTTNTEYIAVAASVFEQVKRILGYDDRPWTPDERQALLQSVGQKAGWDDPHLDRYYEPGTFDQSLVKHTLGNPSATLMEQIQGFTP